MKPQRAWVFLREGQLLFSPAKRWERRNSEFFLQRGFSGSSSLRHLCAGRACYEMIFQLERPGEIELSIHISVINRCAW